MIVDFQTLPDIGNSVLVKLGHILLTIFTYCKLAYCESTDNYCLIFFLVTPTLYISIRTCHKYKHYSTKKKPNATAP